MAVRRANFVDTPGIGAVYSRALMLSRYADTCKLDVLEFKKMLVDAIQRHGHMNINGTLVLVSETDGEIRGFAIGILDQPYPALDKLIATDLLFINLDTAEKGDGAEMLDQLMAWAESNPKVIRAMFGVTDAVGDPGRASKLYERAGLDLSGYFYSKWFNRTDDEQAKAPA